MSEQPRTPRFRIVLEGPFPDADPWDPSDYQNLIDRWKQSLENNQVVPCKDVRIKEILTIGNGDDFDDWRYHRGAYDVSTWPRKGLGMISGRKKDDKQG